MKKNVLWIILFMQVAFSGFAQSKSEKAVLELSKKKFDWMTGKKYDSLKMVLDDDVRYIHSNGWIQNKKEVIDDCVSGKVVYEKIEVLDATARVYDNAAIVTGKGKFSGLNSGNSFALELMYTEVYINKKGHWLLASRHANRMP